MVSSSALDEVVRVRNEVTEDCVVYLTVVYEEVVDSSSEVVLDVDFDGS